MSKFIRIYRTSGYYFSVGHSQIGSRRYCNLDSLVSDLFSVGISPLNIDFSDIDKTLNDYERNED